MWLTVYTHCTQCYGLPWDLSRMHQPIRRATCLWCHSEESIFWWFSGLRKTMTKKSCNLCCTAVGEILFGHHDIQLTFTLACLQTWDKTRPLSSLHSPSLPNVKEVSHHPEQHLSGVDGTVVICRHLVTDQVLALLGRQLLAFTEGIDVDKVVDVFTPGHDKTHKAESNTLEQ